MPQAYWQSTHRGPSHCLCTRPPSPGSAGNSAGHPGSYTINISAKRRPTRAKRIGKKLTVAYNYTQCFTGMSLTEGWCSICTSMDHGKATCPYKPTEEQPGHRKPPLKPKLPQKRLRTYTKSEEPCRKWNRFNYMDCPHGDTCIFTHQCSICRGYRPWCTEVRAVKSPT